MRSKTRQGIYLCLVAALLFGTLAGVALPEVFRMREGTYAGFFSLYGMEKMQEMEVLLWPIFGYLLSSRLRTLLFLWMSSYTPLGLWMHLFFAGWLGCSGGMLLSLFALRQGVQGIGLFFCCTLPQWIFLRTAVEKGTAAFPVPHSAAGRFQRRSIPVSFKKSED